MEKILTIHINHRYFTKTHFGKFQLIPDAATRKLFQKNGIIEQYAQGKWYLFCDRNQETLWVSPDQPKGNVDIDVTLTVNDPVFFMTMDDPDVLFKKPIEHTDIHCILRKERDDVKEEKNGNIDLKRSIGSWEVSLQYTVAQFLKPHKEVNLHFNVKDAFWKYYIFGRPEHDEMLIRDANTQTDYRFVQARNEILANGKVAKTFLSNTKIPLADSYKCQLTLISRKEGRERLIVNRLPTAAVKAFSFERDKNNNLLYSMYVAT